MNKRFLSVILFLQIFQTVLLSIFPINVFPEFFFLPWLVANGKIPYRDFFDHHGFLVNYLFIPATIHMSLLIQRFIFVVIRNINLLLFVLILKKYTSKKYNIAVAGVFYILLQFFFSENNIWFEMIVEMWILGSLFCLLTKKSVSTVISGVFLAAAVVTKQTSGIFLVPLLLKTKQKKIFFISFFISLAVFILPFLVTVNMSIFITDTILFNSAYPAFFRQNYTFFLHNPIAITISVIVGLSIIISWLYERQIILREQILFIICGAVMLYPKFDSVNYSIIIPFVLFFLHDVYFHLKEHMKRMYICLLCIFLLLIIRYDIRLSSRLHTQIPYAEDTITKQNIDMIKTVISGKNQNMYVFGNQVEYYYFTNRQPVIYYPLIFPWIVALQPGLEDRLIHDIQTNKVEFVIIPLPVSGSYTDLDKLNDYIHSHYQPVKSTTSLEIYQKSF